ncbi:MAG TPA: lantibiotic dehydratase C-terminal domain-containing protein [Thermoanaerobaculia bacterium]
MDPLATTLANHAAAAAALRPDPVLSANIYCSGRLCEVICQVAAPFWERCRAAGTTADGDLWLMRYARRGEHLKLRLHGPRRHAAAWRQLLEAAQAEYFLRLGPAVEDAPRRSAPTAPPIDVEDRAAHDQPDRSFLWTTYARSALSLGWRPLLDDDRHAAALTRCLSRGTEILLARLRSDAGGASPFGQRRAILLDAVIVGLAHLPLSELDRTRYLLYHRDCLLRYLQRHKAQAEAPGQGPAAMARVLARFDAELVRHRARHEEIAAAAREQWQSGPARVRAGTDLAWGRALRELAAHGTRLCGELEQPLDPFADLPVFPVLFKALHGLANQAGVDPLNEAFVHHLLLSLASADAIRRRPVRLVPDL